MSNAVPLPVNLRFANYKRQNKGRPITDRQLRQMDRMERRRRLQLDTIRRLKKENA